MLVGPAGSGKSITLVKLAAEAALRGEAAAVLTTDTVRAGALAQLSGYTDIMQQPLMEADTPETLHAAILNQPNVRLLIDTPSTNPYNADELADLSRFIDVCDVDPVLVLPAGLNAQDAADMSAIFSRLGCRTLIATQLDVARRLGAILAAAQGGNLALSVVSISPSIAKGLTPLNPMSLARVLLRDPGESHAYEQTGVRQA
jgi:flagellar biosynthesis protein FlhF